tara:strand:- start:2323 stop:3378 length:1056 start_codon:yes stop_codon:yes gene_type:complete
MGHNVFGERFHSLRVPAWHSLGTTFTEAISASESLIAARMLYGINKYDLVALVEDGTKAIQLEQKAIIRDPTEDDNEFKVFGVASDQYKIMQNSELGTLLDPLTNKWPVETVGALGNGETVFITLDAGEIRIKDDYVHQYFLITDTKNGTKALQIAFTPVRVVCQNTLSTAMNAATMEIKIKHDEELFREAEFHLKLTGRMQVARDQVIDKFEAMANTTISDEEFKTVLDAAYPMPKKPKRVALLDSITPDSLDKDTTLELMSRYKQQSDAYESGVESVVNLRNEVTKKLWDEQYRVSRATTKTAWSAYNAITEAEDWRNGNNAQVNSLIGLRAKTKKRAFAAAMELVGGA